MTEAEIEQITNIPQEIEEKKPERVKDPKKVAAGQAWALARRKKEAREALKREKEREREVSRLRKAVTSDPSASLMNAVEWTGVMIGAIYARDCLIEQKIIPN